MNVPFVDLRAQHDELRPAIEAVLRDALDRSAFIGGPRVTSFEDAFAHFCGAGQAVAVASGTDALELALRAVGVGPGAIVITVPNTFIATVEAVVQLGAVPRFVDIDPVTYNLDPERLRAYLVEHCERDPKGTLCERDTGLRVAAIVPVHLYGLPAEMSSILALAREFGIEVIEDACQAHGAEYRLDEGHWAKAGTLGHIGCFSFYPGKNLGAIGEAGAIVTDDTDVAAQVRLLRDHGQSERYVHVTPHGVNGRMDAIQAAVLEIKLGQLQTWNARRREAAGWYADDLQAVGLQLPIEPEGMRHVYHLYVVRVPERDRVRAELDQRGVQTGLHYPVPLHLQLAFARLELPPGSYPVAEAAASQILALPMYPHISREQVAYVCQQLREVLP
ncbi:MAG: DegT/DnrJ/EryC1/StrS family aminotransferase [Chloroflexota bacterium]|nr:DegT/DnrJ/EryC1/StrS family aminotransferase [Chloroflexota bacterium]